MTLQFDSGAYSQAYGQGQQNEEYNKNRLLELLSQVGKTGEGIAKLQQQKETRDSENQPLWKLLGMKQSPMSSSNQLSAPVANGPMPQEMPQEAPPMSTPIQGTQIPGQMPLQAPVEGPRLPQGPQPGGFVDHFQAWKQGQTPQTPSTPTALPYGLSPEVMNMNLRQVGALSKAKSLFQGDNEGIYSINKQTGQMEKTGSVPKGSHLIEQPNPSGSIDSILAQKVSSGEMTLEDAYKLKNQYSPAMGSLDFRKTQAAEQQKSNMERQNAAMAAQNQEAQSVIGKLDEAISKTNNLSAGFGSYSSGIPGSPAMDLSTLIESIHSSLGLDKLMEMKANSKAGASGLGQLSDKEMSLLVANVASLRQAQSPKQLKDKLSQVKKHYENIIQMNQGINPFGQGNQSGNQSTGTQPSQKPKTVIQNGHTYTLNEATGQYE